MDTPATDTKASSEVISAERQKGRLGEARWPEVAAQSVLQVSWFVILPALLAGVVSRRLVPTPMEAHAGWAQPLARVGSEHGLFFCLALFLGFAVLTRYTRFYLPGGRYLSALPARIAQRMPREAVRACAPAAELYQGLAGLKARRRAPGEKDDVELESRLLQLRLALESADPLRIAAAEEAMVPFASPMLRARDRRRVAVFLASVATAAGLALIVRGWVFGSYQVLSASMLPTLEPGDLLAGNKLAYGLRVGSSRWWSGAKAPRRGEVIVFQRPAEIEGPDELVKRVIGLPGDKVSMRGRFATINGWEVPSCDAGTVVYPIPWGAARGTLAVEFLDDHAYLTMYAAISPPWLGTYEVKPGEVFVLGDNRNNSSDSRAWKGGMGAGLPVSAIDARVDKWIAGLRRDQRVDLDRVLQPIDLRLHLEGMDTSLLKQGIERCVNSQPKNTHPPPASAASASASLGDGHG